MINKTNQSIMAYNKNWERPNAKKKKTKMKTKNMSRKENSNPVFHIFSCFI